MPSSSCSLVPKIPTNASTPSASSPPAVKRAPKSILKALGDEKLALIDDGKRAVIEADGKISDALTGAPLGDCAVRPRHLADQQPHPRRARTRASAALRLGSPDRGARLAAARDLQGSDNADALPLIEKAIAAETDAEVKATLKLVGAALALKSDDPKQRAQAATALAGSTDPQVRQILATLLTREKDGSYPEPDEAVRAAAQSSLNAINSHLRTTELILSLFSGVSLGSILLLAALGSRDHLRPDGHHQHGPRRVPDDRRLHDLSRAGRVPRLLSGRLRRLRARRAADRLRGHRGHRHGARAQRAALALRPAARDAAHDLGREPAADPGLPHLLRRAERRSREPELDVGRHPARRRLRDAVQPPRDHRLRAGRAVPRLAGDQPHAHGPVRARRHAEPRDGQLHRRADASRRHADLRPRLGRCRPRRRGALADRQRRSGSRPELHRRQFHGRGARRRRPARRHRDRGVRPGVGGEVPRAVLGSGAGEDLRARSSSSSSSRNAPGLFASRVGAPRHDARFEPCHSEPQARNLQSQRASLAALGVSMQSVSGCRASWDALRAG